MKRLKKIAFMRNLFVAIAFLALLGLVISSQAMAYYTVFEENDPGVYLSGNWTPWPDPEESGGRGVFSNDTGATCSFFFTGTEIYLIGAHNTDGGTAEITITNSPDPDIKAPVSFLGETEQHLQLIYGNNSLNPGSHTITIKPKTNYTYLDFFFANTVVFWKDYNGDAPGGYMPDIDQNQDFRGNVRTEETWNPGTVDYVGNWPTKLVGGASGGQLAVSKQLQPQASCTFTFHGTSIKWIGAKCKQCGKSDVFIDGNLKTTVDLYNATPLLGQVLYTESNLTHVQDPTNKNHTITIKPTNQKNPLSTDYYTVVDAFDVDDIAHEYCAPVAEANSLWWLDKKYRLGIFGNPYTGTGYIGGDRNGDGKKDILDLVQDLAVLMNTNVGHTGTYIGDEQTGIDFFLASYPKIGLQKRLEEHTYWSDNPQYDWLHDFHYLEEQVELSQDVKLDLGFWRIEECSGQGPGNGTIMWRRVGGHAVTVAGVDSVSRLFAISDPDNDKAEAQAPGVVRPIPNGHPLHPANPTIHNNEANASHDYYTVVQSPSPGGKMGLLYYPGKENFPQDEWVPPLPNPGIQTPWPQWFTNCQQYMILTEIEAAVIVSPKNWPQVRCDFSRTGPLVMTRGGSIGFMASVYNDDANVSQIFKFATAVTSPDNNRYADALKKVIGPTPDITLDPADPITGPTSKSKYLTLSIPLNAPYGNYTYRGYVGQDPDFYPECEFNFSVVK